jgi:hypothetical protein
MNMENKCEKFARQISMKVLRSGDVARKQGLDYVTSLLQRLLGENE